MNPNYEKIKAICVIALTEHMAANPGYGGGKTPEAIAESVLQALLRGEGGKFGDVLKITCKRAKVPQKKLKAYLCNASVARKTMQLASVGGREPATVRVYAYFDYSLNGKTYALAVTDDVNKGGFAKCVTHVASTKRVCGLAMNAEAPEFKEFTATRGDVKRALVCMKKVLRLNGAEELAAVFDAG